MNKTIKKVAKVLIPSTLLLVVFFYGVGVGKFKIFPYYSLLKVKIKIEEIKYQIDIYLGNETPGRWRKAISGANKGGLSEDDLKALSKLGALPYLGGYNKAPDQMNVITYDENKSFEGVTLLVSGHRPGAYLIDMKGKILHEWGLDFDDVWPSGDIFNEHIEHKTFWRRVHLFENGDLLAIFEGIALIKIDKNSKLIWKNKCRAHHDIHVGSNGNIFTLARHSLKKHDKFDIDGEIMEDSIIKLSSSGVLVKSWSILDSYLNSDYSGSLKLTVNYGDFMHTNSLVILDDASYENVPMFREGTALISSRSMNSVALVDLGKEKVVWELIGMTQEQHDPALLKNGNVLIFDNLGSQNNKSRVIEINPMTQEIVWQYKENEKYSFYSKTCGTNQRLPNGNTLIAESDNGRVLEVTPGNEIVWEYLNPNRAGEDNELIATMFEAVRFPKDNFPCYENHNEKCF
jgi:Arylsulfotransferase (ASST)